MLLNVLLKYSEANIYLDFVRNATTIVCFLSVQHMIFVSSLCWYTVHKEYNFFFFSSFHFCPLSLFQVQSS